MPSEIFRSFIAFLKHRSFFYLVQENSSEVAYGTIQLLSPVESIIFTLSREHSAQFDEDMAVGWETV